MIKFWRWPSFWLALAAACCLPVAVVKFNTLEQQLDNYAARERARASNAVAFKVSAPIDKAGNIWGNVNNDDSGNVAFHFTDKNNERYVKIIFRDCKIAQMAVFTRRENSEEYKGYADIDGDGFPDQIGMLRFRSDDEQPEVFDVVELQKPVLPDLTLLIGGEQLAPPGNTGNIIRLELNDGNWLELEKRDIEAETLAQDIHHSARRRTA